MATVRQGLERDPSDDRRTDIFPALGKFVGGGVAACVTISMIVGEAVGYDGSRLLIQGALSAGLGAILGLFVGLGRGLWHSGQMVRVSESAPAPHQLWDPWLDNGRDLEGIRLESAGSLAEEAELPVEFERERDLPTKQARVRPRVISSMTGEPIPLQDEIGPMLQAGQCGLVTIVGGPGSGKSTALQHLAAILPPWASAQVCLLDEPGDNVLITAVAENPLVIATVTRSFAFCRIADYHLASWSQDDVIEYLLSAHRDRCASVMARLKADDDHGFLRGIPELWTVVLDRMARDESVGGVRTAIRCELGEWFDKHPRAKVIVDTFCLRGVGQNDNLVLNLPTSALSAAMPAAVHQAIELLRLVRHRPVGLLIAADRIKTIVESGKLNLDLSQQFPRDLVQEAALAIAGNSVAIQYNT